MVFVLLRRYIYIYIPLAYTCRHEYVNNIFLQIVGSSRMGLSSCLQCGIKISLEVYPRKRARHAILKYGNACVLSSGGGSAQVKTWWKPPLTRWRKFEKKLRLPFFRLKSWKGCYSQSRWTFFLERFSMKKNAPRCDEILIFIIFVGRQRFRRDVYGMFIIYFYVILRGIFQSYVFLFETPPQSQTLTLTHKLVVLRISGFCLDHLFRSSILITVGVPCSLLSWYVIFQMLSFINIFCCTAIC